MHPYGVLKRNPSCCAPVLHQAPRSPEIRAGNEAARCHAPVLTAGLCSVDVPQGTNRLRADPPARHPARSSRGLQPVKIKTCAVLLPCFANWALQPRDAGSERKSCSAAHLQLRQAGDPGRERRREFSLGTGLEQCPRAGAGGARAARGGHDSRDNGSRPGEHGKTGIGGSCSRWLLRGVW